MDYSDEELTPPDAELAARLEAAEAALQRLRRAERESRQLRVPYRNVQYDGPVAARVEGERTAAYDAAKRAQDHYNRGLEMHPGNELNAILSEAEGVRAPTLSGWQWLAQNPSWMEAVPLSGDQRDEQARVEFIARRVHEANRRPLADPMSWANYRGPSDEQMAFWEQTAAELYGVPGTEYSGNPERRRQLGSPYQYRQWNRGEDGEILPVGEQVLEGFRPLNALWGVASRFHDNFLSGGAAVSEGRGYDAAKSFAYSVPNIISPAFHRGGPGMEDDWRSYVSPGEAAAIDTAADLPWWFFRGITRPRPGRGLVAGGVENRIRGYREELLKPLWKRAAQRHHPDVGGSTEAMQRVNAAFDAGDVETLSRMAQ